MRFSSFSHVLPDKLIVAGDDCRFGLLLPELFTERLRGSFVFSPKGCFLFIKTARQFSRQTSVTGVKPHAQWAPTTQSV